jgi:hypothetical protein
MMIQVQVAPGPSPSAHFFSQTHILPFHSIGFAKGISIDRCVLSFSSRRQKLAAGSNHGQGRAGQAKGDMHAMVAGSIMCIVTQSLFLHSTFTTDKIMLHTT